MDDEYEPTEAESIQFNIDDAKLGRDNYLRKKGWKHTSNTPGCYWVWTKDTERYGRLMATTDLAFSMETSLEIDEYNLSPGQEQ